MTSNLLNNQATGLATLPLLREVKLKVAPLELPFVLCHPFEAIFQLTVEEHVLLNEPHSQQAIL
jgi:hypothetical protein